MKINPPETPVQRDRFAALALAYLLLPSVIFLLTWLRAWIGVPAAFLVVAAFIGFARQVRSSPPRPQLMTGTWVFVLALALVWTLLAGMGGFVPQASDYEKHNLVFHDLLHQPWPVQYVNGDQTHYLCYGVGYYLAPALMARTLGETWLPLATFLWGFAGVALFFYWVAVFSRSPLKTLAIVLAFATTETLWHLFLHALHTPPFTEAGQAIRASLIRLGVESDYSDNFASLQFRPQHVLSAWLGAALFYDLFWVRRTPRGALLIWAACWLWSPLMSLGLLLAPVAALGRWRWRDAIGAANLGGGLLLVIVAVYFQGHVPLTENGPIWKFSNHGDWLALYPCFLLLQLSPMLCLYLADRKYQFLGELRRPFHASFLVLLLLPLYKIGYYGDLRLQAATPALLFCGLAASRCFQSGACSLRRPVFALLVASQFVGAAYPFVRTWEEALGSGRRDYAYAATQQRYGYENLSDFKRDGFDYAAQYLGRTNSLAARWLLR